MTSNANIFLEYVDYVFDDKNKYKREKYLGNRIMNGTAYSLEASIRLQYCVGSSYAEGWIGNLKFRIYICPYIGYRAFACNADEVIDENTLAEGSRHKVGNSRESLLEFITHELIVSSKAG